LDVKNKFKYDTLKVTSKYFFYTAKYAMKIFSLCAALSGSAVAWGAASTSLSGTWKQVFSNRYVQSTSEMDWRCIKAYAMVTDKHVFVHKLARHHGGPQIVGTPSLTAQIDGGKMTRQHSLIETPVKKDSVYDIHAFSNDTIVITGEDNPALFVWTRDGSRDPDPVDIPRHMAFVDKIGFKVNETDIVQTYDENTC
jgi:hypothetical protein